MQRRSLALLLLVASTGCRRLGTAENSGPAGPSPTAAMAPESALDTARRLALAPTKENAVVDRRIAALTQLVKAHPERADLFVDLGRTWIRKARETSDPGYFLNANASADLALDLSPNDVLALDVRAMVLLNQHEFRRARDVARTILERDPDAAFAWGTLSDALLELGELEEADRAAQRMMDLKPSLASYSRVSYLQWLAGNTCAATESARLAIDAGGDPHDAEPRAWMLVQAAMLFWHAGDYAGADAGFRQALEVVGEYPPALVGRGRVAMAEGDATRAAAFYDRAWRASPLVETAWLLGEARELAGDEDGARRAFALAEKEGKTSDRRTLSLMYSSRKTNAVEALRLAEEERAARGDIYTEDALAWALYRNGRYGDAETAIRRARRYGTEDGRLLFHEGAIAKALGHGENGNKLLAAALRLNPKFDVAGAAEARALLEDK
ncbi:MAG TPA: tetratricopeptide repeat protein [Polyangiaceae bacterium]|nr:tetratricopeptide repeat protein [Polyangiaceae bacterium]